MLGLVGVGEESGILRLLDAGTPFFLTSLQVQRQKVNKIMTAAGAGYSCDDRVTIRLGIAQDAIGHDVRDHLPRSQQRCSKTS